MKKVLSILLSLVLLSSAAPAFALGGNNYHGDGTYTVYSDYTTTITLDNKLNITPYFLGDDQVYFYVTYNGYTRGSTRLISQEDGNEYFLYYDGIIFGASIESFSDSGSKKTASIRLYSANDYKFEIESTSLDNQNFREKASALIYFDTNVNLDSGLVKLCKNEKNCLSPIKEDAVVSYIDTFVLFLDLEYNTKYYYQAELRTSDDKTEFYPSITTWDSFTTLSDPNPVVVQEQEEVIINPVKEEETTLVLETPQPVESYSQELAERLKGQILLQVENNGEAWYVNKDDLKRYYMKDGAAAYEMMRSFGLGITNADLARIPAANSVDEIKNKPSICASNSLANRLSGNILLQVQEHGEAWYVYPKNCYRVYMKNGDEAYTIMRYLSLGITNNDLTKIESKTIELVPYKETTSTKETNENLYETAWFTLQAKDNWELIDSYEDSNRGFLTYKIGNDDVVVETGILSYDDILTIILLNALIDDNNNDKLVLNSEPYEWSYTHENGTVYVTEYTYHYESDPLTVYNRDISFYEYDNERLLYFLFDGEINDVERNYDEIIQVMDGLTLK